MEKILSIDVSKRSTGYYINYNNKYGTIKTVKTNDEVDYELFKYIVDKIFKLYDDNKCDLILMEDGFSFGKNKKETQKLVELRACIKYESLKRGIKIITYPPTVIKLAVAGKGNASKKDIYDSIKNIKRYSNIIEELGDIKTKGKEKNDDIFDVIAIYETYLKLDKEEE